METLNIPWEALVLENPYPCLYNNSLGQPNITDPSHFIGTQQLIVMLYFWTCFWIVSKFADLIRVFQKVQPWSVRPICSLDTEAWLLRALNGQIISLKSWGMSLHCATYLKVRIRVHVIWIHRPWSQHEKDFDFHFDFMVILRQCFFA